MTFENFIMAETTDYVSGAASSSQAAADTGTVQTETQAEGTSVTSSQDPQPQSPSIWPTILMMVAMVAIFYFLLIRPQRKKDKQVKEMLSALKVGDRICTIGGLYGTIAAIKDDNVTLTMGSLQNTIVVARWAIRSVENVALENDAEPQI